jgi:diguanylate cyclase (GGDEF)-like protein/PAS domain S-box-containing protein
MLRTNLRRGQGRPVHGNAGRIKTMKSPNAVVVKERTSVLHALVSSSPDHFYLYDRAGRHLYASPAVAQALGIEQDDFIGKTWQELGFPREVTERFDVERETVFRRGLPWHGELNLPIALGQQSSVHDYILSPVRAEDGSIEAVLVAARDITERKQMEATLQYQALHEGLTGLPNRTLLNDRLEQSLLAAHRSKGVVALLFLDLVDFKSVNDTVGHHGGDLLLQELALRWSGILRASDTLSRVGGDEFVVLLPATDGNGANDIADRLRTAINEPFDIEGHRLHIGVSVGIAVHQGDDEDANTLMQQADEAMYRAKRQRRAGTLQEQRIAGRPNRGAQING